ncbi:MAG: 2-C-methyl-D-erythritol 4-phosphate cytidylyltransferase [Ruminococcaceae bacterium]|nr:2-C-methyl-D-erythritol 4-phosphate cytidylyltransferase [Oscillospiraceae bacterium]
MKLINLIKAIIGSEAKHCTAIIVAAGSGSRMNKNGVTKQMITLAGIPIVVRSILAFEKCKKIKDIIIVAREDEKDIYKEFIKTYSLKKIKTVTTGGKTRQESVLNGFKKISDKCDFVAIHDAARCLITPENIEKVIDHAERFCAATAAVPVKDTIKIADEKGFISSTPQRSRVWAAQTPQIFDTDLYRAAAFYAIEKGFEATDDNSLVENLGRKVSLVDCGYENIKITTEEDLYIAENILRNRSKADG